MMSERVEKREIRSYGLKALIPILIFVGLHIGFGCIFTLLKRDNPFSIMSRYVSVLIAIVFSLIYYEPHRSLTEKVDIYCSKAGKKGVILLGLIVLIAGGFSSAAEAIGGKESLVNLGLTFIPIHFLIPGIFVICAIISTCIGTSMGTLVTMLPIAHSLSSGTGLNPGMVGAAVITGAFLGDNLSMISDTTICATQGVGAEIKDKFRVNFFVALPAALITIVIYMIFSLNATNQSIVAGEYHIETIIPYLIVLILAIKGMDVVMVLTIGIVSCCIIGVTADRISFFEMAKTISSGMENMFWLAVFSTLVSGLIGLVEYYGGIDWLISRISKRINNRRACEAIIGVLSFLVSSIIVNNTMAIIITAPIAKELGEKYKVRPKRMASLLDIGTCIAVMLAPHGSAIMMIQETIGCNYLEIVKYQFYPFLLMLCTAVMIGLKKKKGE